MMRVLGFLTGTAVTVAAFLLVLEGGDSRQPQAVGTHSAEATAEQLSVVAEAIAERVDAAKSGTASDPAQAPQPEPPGTDAEPRDDPQSVSAEPAPESIPESAPEPAVGPLAEARPEATADDSVAQHGGGVGTYLFWSPFRSEWAAQGFAGRLTAATQVPVEVVAAGPGNYRVAFSYQDETERQARVQRIETITGLQLE